jgi:hypothetical protein
LVSTRYSCFISCTFNHLKSVPGTFGGKQREKRRRRKYIDADNRWYRLFGPNWPNSGEIDVIEGVNLAGTDQITLHTAAGCTINTAGSQSGTTLLNSNCNANNANDGCGVTTTTANAYGNSFNNNGGGVYAMQWESSGVYVWFFPRGSIPSDITSGHPVTGNWGLPIVAFNGGSSCNIDSFFANENIVFDTTFCGDVWPLLSDIVVEGLEE